MRDPVVGVFFGLVCRVMAATTTTITTISAWSTMGPIRSVDFCTDEVAARRRNLPRTWPIESVPTSNILDLVLASLSVKDG